MDKYKKNKDRDGADGSQVEEISRRTQNKTQLVVSGILTQTGVYAIPRACKLAALNVS